MRLYNSPPHRVTVQSVASSTDAAGGTKYDYTTLQAAVPCSINTSSSSERDLFERAQIVTSHTIAFLASALTTTLAPGMKLVADDTGAVYHVRGIRRGRAYRRIPAFVYADADEQL